VGEEEGWVRTEGLGMPVEERELMRVRGVRNEGVEDRCRRQRSQLLRMVRLDKGIGPSQPFVVRQY